MERVEEFFGTVQGYEYDLELDAEWEGNISKWPTLTDHVKEPVLGPEEHPGQVPAAVPVGQVVCEDAHVICGG